MLINWFTVIAQVVNFLILVWLLKRYLYKPILNAIDEREKKISLQISNAATKETEAESKLKMLQKEKEDFENAKFNLFSKAKEEAEEQKKKLLDDARTESRSLKEKLEGVLRDEYTYLSKEIKQRTAKEIFEISRKTLKDLANKDLEEEIVNSFVRKLQELTLEERQDFLTILSKNWKDPMVIRSGFALSQKQRDSINKILQGIFNSPLTISFEVNQDLISGIELTFQGQKLSWSIASYLSSLEREVNEVIHSGHAINPGDSK